MQPRTRSLLYFTLLFLIAGVVGYWIAQSAASSGNTPKTAKPHQAKPQMIPPADDPLPATRRADRPPQAKRDTDALNAGALENQRVLIFDSAEALQAFLKRAGGQFQILGRLDALNALRIGFDDYDLLASLLDGAEEGFVFPISTPTPLPDGSIQPGAVGLGDKLREWLGITGDNSAWGKGISIAVLDTGVDPTAAIGSSIRQINLVDLPDDLSTLNGHGTAVASLISGKSDLTPGVLPESTILSVRIADDSGTTNSFTLAQGIIAAADAGVSLINISYFSESTSSLINAAIDYAYAKGALVFVSSGNNGLNIANGIAANDKAIVVGAVDAFGDYLDFSNFGDQVDIAAPGYAINAAWPGDQAISASGTSFSAPIVAASVGAIMSQFGYTAPQAWSYLTRYLNDTGSEGFDPYTGAGMPAIDRALLGNTPGTYDVAVASLSVVQPTATQPNGQVALLVQNRGTSPVVNTTATINNGSTSTRINITTLAPGATRTLYVPINHSIAASTDPITISATLGLSGGITDVKLFDNTRSLTYAPATSP